MRDTNLVNKLREHADWWENGDMMEPLGGLEKDLLAAADQLENQNAHIAALQQEIEKLRGQNEQLREAAALVAKESTELLERRWGVPVEELAEADRAGRLVVLPFTSGRTLLSKENINSPRLMKDVKLAIRYCSSCGIVFHMDYNVFCDLVKHGRITAVSEETEKVLGAKKDE